MKSALALVIPTPDVPAVKSDRVPYPIPRRPQHEQAEQRLAALRAQRKVFHAQLDAMAAASPLGLTGEMRAAVNELAALEGEVRRVRLELAPLRDGFLRNLRIALRAPCRAEARRAIEAIAQLEDALSVLNGFRGQVRRAGGVAPDFSAKLIMPLAMMLTPIASGPRKGTEHD